MRLYGLLATGKGRVLKLQLLPPFFNEAENLAIFCRGVALQGGGA